MKSIFEMSGAERAAALLVALGPEIASNILRHLEEESIEKISLEIAKFDSLSSDEKENLIGEFLIDLKKAKSGIYGGENKARELLIEAFGREKADELLIKIKAVNVEKEFDFLEDVDTELLVTFLKDEHSQTLAVALSYFKPEKSAKIIEALEPKKAKEIALCMAKMSDVNPEAVSSIAIGLKEKYKNYLKNAQSFKSIGGINSLTEILSFMNGEEEKKIMGFFDHSMPDVSKQIRDKIFSFDNIVNLNNKEIRILVDEINDDSLIARALKGADDDIRFKFLRNMSKNRATDILSNIDDLGLIRLDEVEECRDKIIYVMRTLNNSGIIILKKDREIYVE